MTIINIPDYFMVGTAIYLTIMETPHKEYLWIMAIIYVIGTAIRAGLFMMGVDPKKCYGISYPVYGCCNVLVWIFLFIIFPLAEPTCRFYFWSLLGFMLLSALARALSDSIWTHRLWERDQKPRAEGYNPNNQWEYIEEPSTSSETNSQTPPDSRA